MHTQTPRPVNDVLQEALGRLESLERSVADALRLLEESRRLASDTNTLVMNVVEQTRRP